MSVYNHIGNELNEVFNSGSAELNYAYNAGGILVYTRGTPPTPPTPTPVYPVGLGQIYSTYPCVKSPQGMATYGGYIFQYFSDANEFGIYKMSDFSYVNSIPCTVIGHGNTLQFGNIVQSNGFPLLYCFAGVNIYVLSIDLTTFSLVDSIRLSSDIGYNAGSVIDFDNQKIYSLGYTKSSIYDTTGKYIASILDYNDPSTVIESWQLDYLGVTQGLVWDGEHVVVNCNTYNGQYVKFYFINPTTQEIDKTEQFAKEYQSPLDSEYQGFSYEETYYLVSKWVYKDHPSARSLYYEFYSYVPDCGDDES